MNARTYYFGIKYLCWLLWTIFGYPTKNVGKRFNVETINNFIFCSSNYSFQKKIWFFDFILNVQRTSNYIKTEPIYIRPILLNLDQIISRKNALLILSNQLFCMKNILRILTRKKHPKIKLQRLQKIWIWTFGSLVHQINSFQEVLELEQIFQKN